jgi:4a-hydroxytetrahydrobiopterin dehydratase
MTNEEIKSALASIDGWVVVERNGISRLKKSYGFSNFATAMAFTNRVGELAEQDDHHPAILTEWGKVTINWWTHTNKGLSENDFLMAAKVDAI